MRELLLHRSEGWRTLRPVPRARRVHVLLDAVPAVGRRSAVTVNHAKKLIGYRRQLAAAEVVAA